MFSDRMSAWLRWFLACISRFFPTIVDVFFFCLFVFDLYPLSLRTKALSLVHLARFPCVVSKVNELRKRASMAGGTGFTRFQSPVSCWLVTKATFSQLPLAIYRFDRWLWAIHYRRGQNKIERTTLGANFNLWTRYLYVFFLFPPLFQTSQLTRPFEKSKWWQWNFGAMNKPDILMLKMH